MEDKTAPKGLDGFREHVDEKGKSWWYVAEDGWEVFARPYGVGADEDVFPFYLTSRGSPVTNYGVIREDDSPLTDGQVYSNSNTLSGIMLGEESLPTGVVREEGFLPKLSSQLKIDFGVADAAILLGGAILLGIMLRSLVRK